jgi:hypothetical protein
VQQARVPSVISLLQDSSLCLAPQSAAQCSAGIGIRLILDGRIFVAREELAKVQSVLYGKKMLGNNVMAVDA